MKRIKATGHTGLVISEKIGRCLLLFERTEKQQKQQIALRGSISASRSKLEKLLCSSWEMNGELNTPLMAAGKEKQASIVRN